MNPPFDPKQVTHPDRSGTPAVPGCKRLPEMLSEAIRRLEALGEDFAPFADRLSVLRERLGVCPVPWTVRPSSRRCRPTDRAVSGAGRWAPRTTRR